MHNAQPWRFRCHLGHGTVDVRVDLERTLPASDPDRRALHVGCGAALCNLRAAAAAGRRTGTELLPDPEDPLLLGVVRLTQAEPDAGPDAALAALEPQIPRRVLQPPAVRGQAGPAR